MGVLLDSDVPRLVELHRPTFTAGVHFEAGEASSEFLEDKPRTLKQRQRQFRHLGAIVLIGFLLACCFVAPLVAHLVSR